MRLQDKSLPFIIACPKLISCIFSFDVLFFFSVYTCYLPGEMQVYMTFTLALLWTVQTSKSCPDICKCSRMSVSEKVEVNCHKRGLRAFPSKLPTDAWILKLGDNLAIYQIMGLFRGSRQFASFLLIK